MQGPAALGLTRADAGSAASALLGALEALVLPEQGALLQPTQPDMQASAGAARAGVFGVCPLVFGFVCACVCACGHASLCL